MTGANDPDCRAAFPWDRPETWDDSIRASLRAAFALRHEQPALRDGSFRLAGAQGSMVAWVRALDEAVALVVLNNGDAAAKLAVEAPELAGRWLQAAPLPGDDAPAPFAPASAAFDVSMPARIGAGLPRIAAMSIDTPDWVRDAVFYQIFPDRLARSGRVEKPGPLEPWDAPPTIHGFKGGDLLGVAERLDYLADLGVTALYLTPIFPSASNHRYHTYDYFQVDPLLGGDAALRELLDAAHGRGMRVVLDGVFNHTGRGFWPFHHILENGARVAVRRLVPRRPRGARQGRPLRAYPDESRRHAAAGHGDLTALGTETSLLAGLRGLVGPAGAAQAQHRQPAGARVPAAAWPSTGCASGSTAGGSTCRPRSTTRPSGGSSGAAAGRSTRTRTSSARSGTRRPSGCAATGSTR